MKHFFFDTETTGFNENGEDKLIQLCVKLPQTGSVINSLYWSEKKISFWAMKTHHITEKMIEWKQKFEEHEDFVSIFALSWFVPIAHNAQFDLWILKNYWIHFDKYICTYKLAVFLFGKIKECESYSLQYLRYYLWLEFDQKIDPHDALSDVLVLEALFQKIAFKMESNYENPREKMIEISMTPLDLSDIPLSFWKYKWRTPRELYESTIKQENDRLSRAKKTIEDNEDLQHTIKLLEKSTE